MSVVKIRTNRQVTIPKKIFDEMGLREGEYIEVVRSENHIVLRPKKLVDPDDTLTAEEADIVRKGEGQLRQGEYLDLNDLEHELER